VDCHVTQLDFHNMIVGKPYKFDRRTVYGGYYNLQHLQA